MKDKYKGQITLKTGIELEFRRIRTKAYEETFRQYPFDFVIFSCHQVETKNIGDKSHRKKDTVRIQSKVLSGDFGCC